MPTSKATKTSRDVFAQISAQLKDASFSVKIYDYKPHSKQLVFHFSEAKGRLYIGGNRSGKTVGGCTEAIWFATGTHPYRITPSTPIRGRVVSPSFIDGIDKIIIPEFKKWLVPSMLKGGSWDNAYDSKSRTVHFSNGSFIEFMSYEQELEKFAGTSRHFVWFDEEPPQDIFTECLMRLIDTEGDWWISMTPVEGMTWTMDVLYEPGLDHTNPHIEVVETDMDDNPHLTEAGKAVALMGLSEEDIEARKKGKYVGITGLIYSGFDSENIIQPFVPPRSWTWIEGMDHGFSNPTAWLWAAIDPDDRLFIFDEWYQSKTLVVDHAKEVLRRERMYGVDPDYRVGDPSITQRNAITGTSVHLEYAENGVPIVLGNNDQQAGLMRTATLIRGLIVNNKRYPRLFVTENCVNLLREIKRLRWAHYQSKKIARDRNAKEEQHKKDDHACDALRYIVASRPEYVIVQDEQQDLERLNALIGASTAIPNKSEFTDKEASEMTKPSNFDFFLGEDY